MTTSKVPAASPPALPRSASNLAACSISTKLLGHPWVMISGSGAGAPSVTSPRR
jgi:hypothetical protein